MMLRAAKNLKSSIHNKTNFYQVIVVRNTCIFFVHQVNIYEDSAITVYSIKHSELHLLNI